MPTFGVSVAVIQNGQILLTQRSDLPIWVLPGGAVDDGESLAQAAIRETREETGLEVELTRLVGVYSRPHWRNDGDHSTLFAARPIGGNLQTVTNTRRSSSLGGGSPLNFEQTDIIESIIKPFCTVYHTLGY